MLRKLEYTHAPRQYLSISLLPDSSEAGCMRLHVIRHRVSGVSAEWCTCSFFHRQQTPVLQKPALHQQSTKGEHSRSIPNFLNCILFCYENEIAHLWNGVFQLFREFNVLWCLPICFMQLLHPLCGFFSGHKYT
jgi:hypothetical protein